MKTLDIALKDILRSFRNAFFLVFGLVLPLVTVALFYLAFGGTGSDDDGFNLPTIPVQVVNQDEPEAQYEDFSAGQVLAEFLMSPELSELLSVTEADDVASARSAVDNQEASVAVIIPAGLTAAVFDPEGQTSVEIYQDPTLSLGPGIVKGIVSQFVDGFAGSKIAAGVAYDQFTTYGLAVEPNTLQTVGMEYGRWLAELSESLQGGVGTLLEVRSPVESEEESMGMTAQIMSVMMAGMMVFYVFFAGAAAAGSILQEEEEGMLPRLFTTPTAKSAILGGKFLSVFAVLAVQVAALLFLSSLTFGIRWGAPLPAALVAIGLVVLASSFGIFVNSLLRGSKQAGIIYGGVLTLAGMLGMMRVFAGGTTWSSGSVNTISLFVPQGWAVQGWQLVLGGGGVSDVALTVTVMLALSALFFALGVFRFNRRFS